MQKSVSTTETFQNLKPRTTPFKLTPLPNVSLIPKVCPKVGCDVKGTIENFA